MARQKDELEAVIDLLNAIFDGDARHGRSGDPNRGKGKAFAIHCPDRLGNPKRGDTRPFLGLT
jgi:hypothetical protein